MILKAKTTRPFGILNAEKLMKKIKILLLTLLCMFLVFTGCTSEEVSQFLTESTTTVERSIPKQTTTATKKKSKQTTKAETTKKDKTRTSQSSNDLVSLSKKAEKTVKETKTYTSPQEVAAYIHIYGKLPKNFITKREAQSLGWSSSKGNLAEIAPGKSIGGDRFGNYEELLPSNTKYTECDVNYTGGYRQAERIIFGKNGSIYYTKDHYKTFIQIY
ncbi:hypothetical protein P261_02194 [Lachnospiraceae bacterium TWA4]|nr:hypothetical protein P261_02194 [Lachnospiraceae bacterium TWA4]